MAVLNCPGLGVTANGAASTFGAVSATSLTVSGSTSLQAVTATSITLGNNQFLNGTTTGAVTKNLIGVDATNKVNIDASALGTVFGSTVTIASGLTVTAGGITVSAGTTTLQAVTLHGTVTALPTAALFDVTGSGPGSLANNATGTLGTPADGFMFIADRSGDHVALVLLTAGTTVTIVSQTGSIFTTTSGNASTINVYYSTGTLTVENKTGVTKSITSFLAAM